MNSILEYGLHLTLVFSLVFARVAGTGDDRADIWHDRGPKRIRVMLALALAALVTPLQTLELAHDPQTPVDYLLLIANPRLTDSCPFRYGVAGMEASEHGARNGQKGRLFLC